VVFRDARPDRFVTARGDALSALSRREALKNIG
jgi:hypothetical protein